VRQPSSSSSRRQPPSSITPAFLACCDRRCRRSLICRLPWLPPP
jgi:hypothetical protein